MAKKSGELKYGAPGNLSFADLSENRPSFYRSFYRSFYSLDNCEPGAICSRRSGQPGYEVILGDSER